MPSIPRISAFRFFFYNLEGWEPPHVHVEHGENGAKFWLEPVSVGLIGRGHGIHWPDVDEVISVASLLRAA